MVTESVVVVALTLLIAYLYARSGKHGIAASVLPIAVLPMVCLLGALVRSWLPSSILSERQWELLIVITGLVIGGTLLGMVSRNIKRKAARRVYMIMCGGFTVLFAFANILEIIGAL